MKNTLRLALSCALATMLAACGSDDVASKPAPTPAAVYPSAADSLDASGNTNATATGANLIQLNQNYALSIFPQGDIDYVKVTLTAGTAYEFSVNKLCATCDSYLYLYDTDGTTVIDDQDDNVSLDSAIQFTPTVSGTYFLRVEAYDESYGVLSYQLNAHPYIDVDGDNYSSFYDCNDNNNTIYPEANEVAGDGIDQDCSGTDQPSAITADSFESDDTAAQAKTGIAVVDYNAYEARYVFRLLSDSNAHSIHSATDADWIKVVVPAHRAYETDFFSYGTVNLNTYEADGTTLVAGKLTNTTASPKTYLLHFSGDDGSLYLPYLTDLGADKDGDGFYSQDWDEDRDCNDNNAAINPDAAEIPSDHIDQDCYYDVAD